MKNKKKIEQAVERLAVPSDYKDQELVAAIKKYGSIEHSRFSPLRLLRSPTIEEPHIEAAYVEEQLEEQLRIDIYGASEKMNIAALIVGFEPDRYRDWGRAL